MKRGRASPARRALAWLLLLHYTAALPDLALSALARRAPGLLALAPRLAVIFLHDVPGLLGERSGRVLDVEQPDPEDEHSARRILGLAPRRRARGPAARWLGVRSHPHAHDGTVEAVHDALRADGWNGSGWSSDRTACPWRGAARRDDAHALARPPRAGTPSCVRAASARPPAREVGRRRVRRSRRRRPGRREAVSGRASTSLAAPRRGRARQGRRRRRGRSSAVRTAAGRGRPWARGPGPSRDGSPRRLPPLGRPPRASLRREGGRETRALRLGRLGVGARAAAAAVRFARGACARGRAPSAVAFAGALAGSHGLGAAAGPRHAPLLDHVRVVFDVLHGSRR